MVTYPADVQTRYHARSEGADMCIEKPAEIKTEATKLCAWKSLWLLHLHYTRRTWVSFAHKPKTLCSEWGLWNSCLQLLFLCVFLQQQQVKKRGGENQNVLSVVKEMGYFPFLQISIESKTELKVWKQMLIYQVLWHIWSQMTMSINFNFWRSWRPEVEWNWGVCLFTYISLVPDAF